jgi:hypothetical protein
MYEVDERDRVVELEVFPQSQWELHCHVFSPTNIGWFSHFT